MYNKYKLKKKIIIHKKLKKIKIKKYKFKKMKLILNKLIIKLKSLILL